MDAKKYIEHIRNDLLTARKQKDSAKSRALLAVVNAIDNAGAVDASAHPNVTEVARKELTVKDVQNIIQQEAEEIREALKIYEHAQSPLAAELEEQLFTLQNILKIPR